MQNPFLGASLLTLFIYISGYILTFITKSSNGFYPDSLISRCCISHSDFLKVFFCRSAGSSWHFLFFWMGSFATEPFFSLTSCPLFCFSLISFWFQVSVPSGYEQKLKPTVHMIWNNLKAQICLLSKSCGCVFHSVWAPVQPHQYKPVPRLGLVGHGTARQLARNCLWFRLFCLNGC